MGEEPKQLNPYSTIVKMWEQQASALSGAFSSAPEHIKIGARRDFHG
jgi:hypothetical protein